jgi:hypothetical protein
MLGSMARAPVISESDRALLRRLCVPTEHLDEIRIEHDVRGRSVSILECRSPWGPEYGPDWSRRPVAQLRYDPGAHLWTLYWADRDSRWQLYDLIDPSPRVDDLLAEIAADPTCVFWG